MTRIGSLRLNSLRLSMLLVFMAANVNSFAGVFCPGGGVACSSIICPPAGGGTPACGENSPPPCTIGEPPECLAIAAPDKKGSAEVVREQAKPLQSKAGTTASPAKPAKTYSARDKATGRTVRFDAYGFPLHKKKPATKQ